jgi:pimeloyl-ACP methyl ester carboxylesterase
VDADDLAGLAKALHLGKIVVVGHSYGAFAALFFAARYPRLTRALVLAEPPAISLLPRAMQQDIRRRMVAPMKRDFTNGRRERGVADFIEYVFNDPRAWDKMSPSSRSQTMRDAHEWDVMMTTGTLFPAISEAKVRSIRVPTLLLTGDRTYRFLTVINDRLARLLPDNQTVVVHGVGHQMWYQRPELCRDVTQTFLRWALPDAALSVDPK